MQPPSPADDGNGSMRLRRAATVIARRLPDRTVLLNGSTGSCFEINAVGSNIWDQLDGTRSLAEIAREVAERHGLSAARAENDVEEFARALTAAKLLESVHGGP